MSCSWCKWFSFVIIAEKRKFSAGSFVRFVSAKGGSVGFFDFDFFILLNARHTTLLTIGR